MTVKQMDIAAPDSGVTLPLKMLELRTVTLGSSGAGKTAGGRVLFEEAVAAGVVAGAIDLKGDWWGLKSSADGKSPGLKVIIFGGDHQDVPLDERGGAALAEIVADIRQPFIVDLEQLSRAKQDSFLAAFFERLYDVNREPLVLFCDEVDRYAPQKPMTPEAIKSLAATEDLAKRGRKHGIFPKFITQRNASLNKNVAELCDVAIVYRTSGPNDRKAVEAWFEAKATDEQLRATMKVLSGLDTGTAVVCSAHPALRTFDTIAFREPWTFDSSATPEIGKTVRKPKEMAAVDLDAVRSRMAETIERIQANDPAKLKQRVKELEAAIAKATKQTTCEACSFRQRELQEAQSTVKAVMANNDALRARLGEIEGIARRLGEMAAVDKLVLAKPVVDRPFLTKHVPPATQPRTFLLNEQHTTHAPKREAKPAAPRPSAPVDGDFQPNSAQQRVLNALAFYRTVGVDAPGLKQVGFIAKIKASGGHFQNTVGPLSSRGLIERTDGRISLTSVGEAYAVAPDTPPTLSDYHASIRDMLRTSDVLFAFAEQAYKESTLPERPDRDRVEALLVRLLADSFDSYFASRFYLPSINVPSAAAEGEPMACPFCGSAAAAYGTDDVPMSVKLARVACTSCFAMTGNYHTRSEAIAAWNNRAGER